MDPVRIAPEMDEPQESPPQDPAGVAVIEMDHGKAVSPVGTADRMGA
jgi:hypothetical protein